VFVIVWRVFVLEGNSQKSSTGVHGITNMQPRLPELYCPHTYAALGLAYPPLEVTTVVRFWY
jgi:hypothetical protein